MDARIVLGTAVLSAISLAVATIIISFLLPKWEKNIRLSVKLLFNSDCEIDSAIQTIELLEGEKNQHVQLEKL